MWLQPVARVPLIMSWPLRLQNAFGITSQRSPEATQAPSLLLRRNPTYPSTAIAAGSEITRQSHEQIP